MALLAPSMPLEIDVLAEEAACWPSKTVGFGEALWAGTYTYIYIYIFVCMYVRMYACMHACIYIYNNNNIYIYG
jgi:hypothetical protein